MFIIVNNIIFLSIIAVVGYAAFKFKLINSANCDGIVKLIVKIVLPLLIFVTFADADISLEELKNFPFIFAASFISVFFLYFLSSLSGKLLKLNQENLSLHQVQTMFGNVVYLGFPLLNALIPGGKGIIYAAVFQLGHDILMWTVGIYILKKSKSEENIKKGNSLKLLLNPISISFIGGLLFMMSGIKLPDILLDPLKASGQTTIYLSMIYVGAILAQINLKNTFGNLRSYIISLNKLILAPLFIIFLFYLLKILNVNISDDAVTVSVLQAAMPCMVIISVLARDMNLNYKQAVENIFITTLLSILSLPLAYYVIQLVLL